MSFPERLRRRIEHLRQQPSHVRYRAASYLTAVGGLIIGVIWLVVLLPLQLRLNRGSGDETPPEQELVNQVRQGLQDIQSQQPGVPDLPINSGRVGGTRDFELFPSPSSQSPTATPTPADGSSESTGAEEVLPVAGEGSGVEPSTAPVEITP